MVAVYTTGAMGLAACGVHAKLTLKVVGFYVIFSVGHAVYRSRDELSLDD
jgi:hypothetical protein